MTLDRDVLIIAAIVFVAGVALFTASRAEASGASDIPQGFEFDYSLGGYVKRNADGSLVYLF